MSVALLDTNVAGIVLNATGSRRRLRNYILDTFREVRCAVVLHELLRGHPWPPERRQPRSARSGSLYSRHEARETPNWEDWKQAGLALQRLPDGFRTESTLRKMTNDALIAAMCVRNDWMLVTQDRDYEVLASVHPLRKLRWLTLDQLRTRLEY